MSRVLVECVDCCVGEVVLGPRRVWGGRFDLGFSAVAKEEGASERADTAKMVDSEGEDAYAVRE